MIRAAALQGVILGVLPLLGHQAWSAQLIAVCLGAIVLKGAGPGVYWMELAALAAFAVVVLVLASIRLQRQWV